MGQNTLENQKPGFGLERPGQFYDRPQTYRELDGANPYQSFLPPVDPGVLLGVDGGQVETRLMPAPVPEDRLHRNPRSYADAMRPEIELTQFRGQGAPPPLPENPERWEQMDWDAYFRWVATDPSQFSMLREIYQRLTNFHERQG